MITRLTLCCLLAVTWVLQSHLGRVYAKESDSQQSNPSPQCNRAIKLSICSNSSDSENVAADESISASMLKLSHQPAPANLLQAKVQEHHQPSSNSLKLERKESRASQPPPSDKGRRFNLIDPIQPARGPGAAGAQPETGKIKRKGLMSFMAQPRKLSIGSLLPLRSGGAKQPASSTNTSSSQTNSDKSRRQQQFVGGNFPTNAMSEEEFNSMLNEPDAFNDNSPFLHGGPRLPITLQDYHHNHLPSSLDHHNSMGARFDARLMGSMGPLQPPPQLVGPHAHHFAAFQPLGAAQHVTTPQEIFLADQSGEHFQKIKFTGMPSAGGQSLPFILASTSPTVDSQQAQQQQQLNRTALLRAAAADALAQQQRQAASVQSQSAGNASATLASVAANALLSDRAKNLISQLNLAAAAAAAVATNASKSSVRNNRETTEPPAAATSNGNATNSGLMASMLKNAAEAWATTNSMQSAQSQTTAASASGDVSADASPTIIVEHDGPTITTLDYGGQPQSMMPNRAPGGGDDDDVTSNFYTETEEAEQEEGGSHEARRVVQPRVHPRLRHHSHHRHAPQQPPPPPPLHHSLRHPGFGDGTPPGGGGGNMMGQRGGPVPSANEFFEEQMLSDAHSEGAGPPSRPSGQGGIYAPPTPPGYYQARRPPPAQSTTDRYPDSINAIKEQDDRHGSRGKQSSSPSDSDPVEQLIRELQEMHRRRKSSSVSSSSFSSGGARDGDGHDQGSSRGSPRGASSDEFEDILNVSGAQGKGDQEGQQDGGPSGDEDEYTRLLRNKLLDRLRAKHDRKKGALSSSSSSSLFNGDSIRIPMHALLLAALDRRMSPSESKSVSTSAEGSPGAAGPLDERNRELILAGRQDFNEATADLGSLLDGNNLFEQLVHSVSGRVGDEPTQQQLTASAADDSLRLPLNLQNISQESLTPAGMLLIENLAALDETNQRRINLSDVSDGGSGNVQFAHAATTRMPATTNGGPGSTGSTTTTSTTSTTTTATPTTSSAPTSAPQQLRDAEMDLQRHRGGRLPSANYQRSFKNHRDASSGSGAGGAQKGRRALRDEGDFDVDRHVDEYANDKNDGSLEPSWMKSPRNRRVGGRPREGTVEFDDEFDEIDRQTRRKMQQQHHKRRRAGARGKHGEGNKNDDTEAANYEANEQRFFNKMQRDTDANIGDVDQTIRSIERSIPDNEQPARTRAHRGHHRGRAEPRSSDEDEEPQEAGGRPNGEDQEGDDEGEEASEPRRSRESRRSRAPEAAESQQSAATLRASMIDDEISRMEAEAKHKQRRLRKTQGQSDQDPDENDQQDESGGEPSESQIETTRQALADESQPDTRTLKIVVEGDSSGALTRAQNVQN